MYWNELKRKEIETRIPVTYPRKDDSFNDDYKVVFYNVLSRIPVCQIGTSSKNEHVQACHMSTGLLSFLHCILFGLYNGWQGRQR